jgi:hypothetical protein
MKANSTAEWAKWLSGIGLNFVEAMWIMGPLGFSVGRTRVRTFAAPGPLLYLLACSDLLGADMRITVAA